MYKFNINKDPKNHIITEAGKNEEITQIKKKKLLFDDQKQDASIIP